MFFVKEYTKLTILDTRKLLSTTLIYGIADVIVLAVGGFLLLPLYTRTLSQSDFGLYVTVRANIEIITFVLFLGMPSAFSRVYFDFKSNNQQIEYINSVLTFFLFCLVFFGAVSLVWGEYLWGMLSPNTPIYPYLGYSLSIVVVGFFGTIASLWLRMEQRVKAFVSLQVGAALVLTVAAVTNLLVFRLGLSGLLLALFFSGTCSAFALPWLMGRRFRPVIRWEHISVSMHYAIPIMIGYLAYFMLNRFSILILQRHVSLDQIAIFGLAQQLAMVVTIASSAFGKALQPSVFAAESAQAADEMIKRLGKLLMLMMFCFTSMAVLFSSDIYSFMAPKNYGEGYEILLILLLGSFAYSFTLISDTALLYHRKPKSSVLVTIIGAALSVLLALWLVPQYELYGAALAISCSFFVATLVSHWFAYRVTGFSYLVPMMIALGGVGVMAAFVGWFQHHLGLSIIASISLRFGIGTLTLFIFYFFGIKKVLAKT